MSHSITKTLIISVILIFIIFSGCIEVKSTDANANSSNNQNIKIIKNSKNLSNDTIPPGAISYLRSNRGENWINWIWDNPKDKDFDHVMIYIDGKFRANVAKKNFFNLTGLASSRQYKIGILTVDVNKNVNYTWINDSTSTLIKYVDRIPPDKVWYLDASDIGRAYINWTWENPTDADYAYANIYVNGKFMSNISKPKEFYLFKASPNSTYKIGIRTVDTNKNMNPIWVYNTAETLP